MSSLDIDIFVLFRSFNNLVLFIFTSWLSNSSAKVGKLSVGKHNKLKSKLSLFKLNLFSVFSSNFKDEFDLIFLKIGLKFKVSGLSGQKN